MALAFGTKGTLTATGTASLSIAYPASIAADDLLVLVIVTKFDPDVPTTPSGWTLQGQIAGGAGANGADTGTIVTSVWTKTAAGTESGSSLSVTCSASNNVDLGQIFRYTKAAGATWSVAATTGADSTAGTAWSVTGGANPGIIANDLIVACSGINTDAYTFTAQAVSATGISAWGTVNEREDTGTTTGSDVRMVVSDHPVTTGTASAAPVFTMTSSGSATSAPAGSTVMLRLREQTAPTVALNSPADASSGSDTTPTLSFTGTDTESDDIRYNVQVDTANTFDSTPGGDSQLVSNSIISVNGGTGTSLQSEQALAQIITPSSSFSLTSISLGLNKTGSPTDNLSVSVHTTSETGTNLGTSSSVSATSVTAASPAYQVVNFTFSPSISLSSSTAYYFVIERSGANDTSNRLNVRYSNSNPYSGGNLRSRSNNAWADYAGSSAYDAYFVLYPQPTPLLDKLSGTDSGFSGTPDNTDPFTSGEEVSYTVNTLDNFDDNSFDTSRWTRTNSTQVVETGGQLELSSILAGNYVSADSILAALNLTDTNASIKVVNAGNQTTLTSWETYPITLIKDGSNSLTYRIIGNNLQAYKKVAGVSAQVGSNVTYSSSTHVYLRIREASGTIYYDYSTNGTTWTNHTSVANPFAITALQYEISVGTWQAEGTTSTMVVDNAMWGDPLSAGTYYWRVRGIDPSGLNTYGAWATTRSFTVASGSVLTKTQTAVSRIQATPTKTQGATARITKSVTKTQSAISRIQKSFTLTQTAISRVSKSLTKTQTATARITVTATKTQTAIARIAVTGTKTQGAISRISKSITKTQTSTARVSNSLTFTQGATANIASASSVITKTQTAIARITKTLTTTQGAIARITKTVTKTQTATANIAAPTLTLEQVRYRFYDDGTENGSTALAAENTNIEINTTTGDVPTNLRVQLQNTSALAGGASDDFQLQYRQNSGSFKNIPASNAALTDSLDIGNVTNTAWYAGSVKIGQSFTGDGNRLSQASFALSRTGTPSGTVYVEIYAHSGTYGTSSVGTGTVLATSSAMNAIDVSTGAVNMWAFSFSGTDSIKTVEGTKYVAVLVITGSNTFGNDIRIGTNSAGSLNTTHSGNLTYYQFGSWNYDNTKETIFELYSELPLYSFDSSYFFNNDSTTNRLTAGTGSFLMGAISEDGKLDNLQFTANDYTEILYTIQFSQAGIYAGDTIDFRVLYNNSTSALTYTTYPTVTVTANSTLTQSATARISSSLTKTQPATGRITKSVTKTQTAIGRISKSITKTQTAIGRIQKSTTKTQPATASILKTGITKTQTAIARISKDSTKTQGATARIRVTATKTQGATARITKTVTLTQTATASLNVQVTLTQTATALIVVGRSLTQAAGAYIHVPVAATLNVAKREIAKLSVTKVEEVSFSTTRVIPLVMSNTESKLNLTTVKSEAVDMQVVKRDQVQVSVSKVERVSLT